MQSNPTPKRPQKKDAEYMRKAYTYTAFLLVLGLLGSLLLAERIVTTQTKMNEEAERLEAEEEAQEAQEEHSAPLRE